MLSSKKFHFITATVTIYAAYVYICDNLYTKLPIHFDSIRMDDRFKLVANIFRKNFADGWERSGAALTVYFKDRKVLDIWGGYADVLAARKWQMDTIISTFSCLKSVMTLCIALLVERKLANYDDFIIKHWPNFGNNGKANITIKMLLSQEAGLNYLDKPISLENATNHYVMRKIFENEKLKEPVRQESGCYGSTFYWLIDELIRHIDKQKRGVQQFFHDEVASKFEIDYSIGLTIAEEHRVARIVMPSWLDLLSEIYHNPYFLYTLLFQIATFKDLKIYKSMHNFNWLDPAVPLIINNPNFHHLPYHGFGNARSLAKIFHTLSTNGLLSSETQLLLKEVHANSTDICIIKQLPRGFINFLTFINQPKMTYAYGHSGFGCQQVIHDTRYNLTIAYVTNAVKVGVYGSQCRTYVRLQKAIYDIVEKDNEV